MPGPRYSLDASTHPAVSTGTQTPPVAHLQARSPDKAPEQILLAPDEEDPCPWSPHDSAGCAEFSPQNCDHRCLKTGPG